MASDGRWAVNIPNSSDTNNKIFNNILYTTHSWRGSISIATPTLPGFESDYNVIMDRFSANDGSTRLSLAQWQALGYDAHSIIAVPGELFVDPGSGDYHLKPGSPAIDAGRPLADVTEDLETNPRPSGPAYDIGAFEFTPALDLRGAAGNGLIHLTWSVNTALPAGSEWQIQYEGPAGDQPSPVTGIPAAARAYTLTGLTNHTWYTVTLQAVQAGSPILSDSVAAMPAGHLIYLPSIARPQ
jgi:hypothetical protein